MSNYLYIEADGTLTAIDGQTGQRYTNVFGSDPALKAQAVGLIQQRQSIGIQLTAMLNQAAPLIVTNGSSTIDQPPEPAPPPPP